MTGTLGVTAPITPGILPILSTDQVKRFTAVCGATLPDQLRTQLEALGDDADGVRTFGVEFATRQCEELLAGGAPGLHLYSLNRSPSCLEILEKPLVGITVARRIPRPQHGLVLRYGARRANAPLIAGGTAIELYVRYPSPLLTVMSRSIVCSTTPSRSHRCSTVKLVGDRMRV